MLLDQEDQALKIVTPLWHFMYCIGLLPTGVGLSIVSQFRGTSGDNGTQLRIQCWPQEPGEVSFTQRRSEMFRDGENCADCSPERL